MTRIITNVFIALMIISSGVFYSINTNAQSVAGVWSNPVLIAGSSFGNLFQEYYLIGNYDMLLKLTAAESRKLYGDKEILEYYSNMQFAFPIKLIAYQKHGSYWTLKYKTTIAATTSRINMKVILDKDTCRLVLPNNFNQNQYFLFQWK